jgi:hypothetical protein
MLLVGRGPEARLISTHCDSPSCRSPRCPHWRPLRMVDGCDAGVVQRGGILFAVQTIFAVFDAGRIDGMLWMAPVGGTDPCRQIPPTLLAALDHLGMLHCSFLPLLWP